MENNIQFKYYAFISYNSRDVKWGKRLQRKLEHYRMPATLCSERGWNRTPIKPVFFAPMDIQPGGLTAELQERLKYSRNLIVICSPNSAQSKWVGDEIEFFHSLGRTDNIHFFIIEGKPNSGDVATECFNPKIKELGIPEILGANIHEHTYALPWLNKERAFVQIISKLLNVEFDSIWNRHRRQLVQKVSSVLLMTLFVVATMVQMYIANQPIDVRMFLNEKSVHNANLPPLKNASLTMYLENEKKTDTIHSINDSVYFKNIPHRYLGEEVKLSFECMDFISIDTSMILSENMSLDICRDPETYGSLSFKIWSQATSSLAKDVDIIIEGQKLEPDTSGLYSLFLPLERQRQKYKVISSKPLLNDTIYMPCGKKVFLHIEK